MKCIGIDIGSFSVKMFEIHSSPRELQLIDFKEFPLDTLPTSDNKILILDILKKITQVHDPASTRFIFSVSQRQISTRYKTFPFKERNKVLKTIPFELEEDIPFNLEQSVFDAKFVRIRGSSSQVLASATPKQNVSDILQMAQSIGIDPDIISAQGLALANLVEDLNVPPPFEPLGQDPDASEMDAQRSSGHILLDMGHTTTLVTVYRDFRLVAVRTVDWGGSDVAGAIAQRYRIQTEEALKELQSKAFVLTSNEGASRDQKIFSDTIGNSLNNLVRDLKLFVLDSEAEFGIDITHIALTGGASQIRNLPAFLSQKIGRPVNIFDTFERFSLTHLELTPQMRAVAGLALSLATEGAKRPLNPATNYRKNDLSKQNLTLQLFWDRWGYAARLTLVALRCFYIYAFTKSFFADGITEHAAETLREQARVAGMKGAEARPNNIRSYIKKKQLEIRAKETLALLLNMNTPLDILVSMSNAVPSSKNIKLDISDFAVENDNLTINGTVANSDQLKLLNNSLKGMSRNGEVQSRAGQEAKPGKTPFSFQVNIDRKIAAGQ